MTTVYWLTGAAVLLLIEIGTVSLTSIWFAGGAIAAAIASALGLSMILQVAVFIVVSIVLLVLTRPAAVKLLNSQIEKTNADALVGRKCRVAATIDPTVPSGTIIINDVEWSARPVDGESVILEGTEVTIREISGVKLMVEPVNKEETK